MNENRTKAYMIFDIGTGNSRVGIISTAGELLAVATQDSVYYYDHDFEDSIYFVPDEWEKILKKLAREALAKAGDIEIIAISSSSQRQGIVLISNEGKSLVGYQNGDMRGAGYVKDIQWDEVTEITGLTAHAMYSGMKFRATMRRQPYVAETTKVYTSISDWIGFLMTGKIVWERSQAMQSAVYDPVLGNWSEKLCDVIGIEKGKLAQIVSGGTVLGKIKPVVAEEIGVPKSAVFVVGGADTQVALHGSLAEKEEVTIVSGTTTPVVKIKDRFMKVPAWMAPHVIDGEYMLEVNAASTGINLQRMKNLFWSQYTYQELIEKSQKSGIPKMMAMFAMGPHLGEEPVVNGGFLMENPVSHAMEAAEMFHAMSLDIAMSIVLCIDRINKLDENHKGYLTGCGGGLRSPLITQAVADLTGMEIRLYRGYDQATMMGCAYLCNKTLGFPEVKREIVKTIKPHQNPELEKYFMKWKKLRACLRNMN